MSTIRWEARWRGGLTNGGERANKRSAKRWRRRGAYLYCLSAYVRAATPSSVGLTIGSQATQRAVTTAWTRIGWTSNGDAQATSVRFAIEIGAGAAVEVYGLQVEAQAAASGYKASVRGGVYEDAHLGADVLTITEHRRESAFVQGEGRLCKPSLI